MLVGDIPGVTSVIRTPFAVSEPHREWILLRQIRTHASAVRRVPVRVAPYLGGPLSNRQFAFVVDSVFGDRVYLDFRVSCRISS